MEYCRGDPSLKYYEMVDKLVESGVFSFESKGNYQLTGCGVVVSPRSRMSVLYFTNFKDAEKYAKLNFSDALYEVTVDKIEKEIIPKRLK